MSTRTIDLNRLGDWRRMLRAGAAALLVWSAGVAPLAIGEQRAPSPMAAPARLAALPDLAREADFPDAELDPPTFAAPELVPPPGCRATLWLVNTRASCSSAGAQPLHYFVGDGHGHWIPVGLEQFRSTDQPGVPTVVFIHGNRYDEQDALIVGQAMFVRLVRELGNGRPLRFVIWSWPSERIYGALRRDVREKANRGEAEGCVVAQFVGQIPGEVPVCLLGHSYGARVIVTCLHHLAQVESRAPTAPAPARRAVLMAGALDCGWIAPGGAYGMALWAVEHAVVMYNPNDVALKWYPLLWGRGGPPALGYTGLPGSVQAKFAGRVEQLDVEPFVGRRHRFAEYLAADEIWATIRTEAIFASPAR
ncbi:MAG: alpha/beta hydrolase [Pirellulales bacterium]|nr:alpha/beta hydrolase [Pirellulales bacterium]